VAAVLTWRLVPESPVRVPGRVNWLAAGLMTVGVSAVLVAVSETTVWGWTGPKTLALAAFGFAVIGLWIAVEVHSRTPLIDMTMMRIRGVWTTNASAFLLGAGMYASFVIFPQFAQLPQSTGFGFGASVIVSGLYLLPCALGMAALGIWAGRISVRFGSRWALLAGTAFTFAAFLFLAVAHAEPWQMLVSAALLGIGIGLAFAALGNLIVQAVPPEQTGVASGVNTVMRTLGGALGGQLSATFIASNTAASGLPTVTGFTETFWMATGFLALCFGAGLLVPKALGRPTPPAPPAEPAAVPEPAAV
jgi:MFS family permease